MEDASGIGQALAKVLTGDSPAAKNGLIGFAFRDSSGNVVLPQLSSSGALPVDTDGGGPCRTAKGEHAGSTSFVDVTGCEVTINGGIEASSIEADVSCFRDTIFQIVYVDDAGGTPVETVIAEALCGPGQYSYKMGGKCLIQDVSGGTGVQKLKVKGKNLNPAAGSTMRATVWCSDAGGT
jgi:hypothetical protein